MSVFVIADTHLSFGVKKPMDIFGNRWKNYHEKLKNGWISQITDSDTVIIPGDISWAMNIQEALPDFAFLSALPGQKIILKGNHDYWWSTTNKLNNFIAENHFDSIRFLHNNALIAEDFIICGSRGWYPDDKNHKLSENADCKKIVAREAIRLRLSLEAGKKLQEADPTPREIIAFMHFPPYYTDYCCDELIYELYRAGVSRCYFGHIHGKYSGPEYFEYCDIRFYLIYSDFLKFIPKKIEATSQKNNNCVK